MIRILSEDIRILTVHAGSRTGNEGNIAREVKGSRRSHGALVSAMCLLSVSKAIQYTFNVNLLVHWFAVCVKELDIA